MRERERAIREWADAVKGTDRGSLLLANLAHELDSESIPAELLARLVGALADCWLGRAGNTPLEVFRNSLKRVGAAALCQGQPTLPRPQRCSRIMTAPDFVRHHVKMESGGLIPEYEVPTHVIQHLEQDGLADLAKGVLQTSQPVVWVTESSAIERVRAASEPPRTDAAAKGAEICEIATQLRERLGLNHYAEDQQLLELVYPEGLRDDECPLHPPTILDGIGSIYYRSGRIGGWGVTVDLASGEAGLPEAVHPPTNLTQEFRVRNLGRIRSNKTCISYTNIAERAPTQWSSSLLEKLTSYLEDPGDALN